MWVECRDVVADENFGCLVKKWLKECNEGASHVGKNLVLHRV